MGPGLRKQDRAPTFTGLRRCYSLAIETEPFGLVHSFHL